jgi:hypothetical protein
VSLLTNLVAYWKLDEASGNALDAVGSNTLTDNGSVGTGTGKIGNCRTFSSSYFDHANNSDFGLVDEDFTFAAWIKPSSLGGFGNTILVKGDLSGGGVNYGLSVNTSGKAVFVVTATGVGSGSVTANTFGALSAGTWYHVVGWHDSVNNIVGISVNAGTPDTTSYSSGTSNDALPFRLGSDANFLPFAGSIDEVGFWKRALDSTDRTSLYNGGSGLAFSSFGGGGGGGATTGTLAVAADASAVALAATVVQPPITGVLGATAVSPTVALAATNTPLAITGTLATTATTSAVSLAATNTPLAITAALGASAAASTVTLAATNVPSGIIAAMAAASGVASVAFAATNVPPPITGTLGVSATAVAVALAATNTPLAITATLAAAATSPSVALAATSGSAISASLVVSAASPSVALAATVVQPPITGVLAVVAGTSTVTLNATVLPPPITASLAAGASAASVAIAAANVPRAITASLGVSAGATTVTLAGATAAGNPAIVPGPAFDACAYDGPMVRVSTSTLTQADPHAAVFVSSTANPARSRWKRHTP